MSKYESRYKSKYHPVELPKEEKEYLRIECPSCNTNVEADNLNINDKIAKCSSCSVVFSFENKMTAFTESNSQLQKPIQVEKLYIDDDLEISIRNSANALYFVVLATFPIFIMIASLLFFAEGVVFAGIVNALLIFGFSFSFFRLIFSKRNRIYFVANKDYLLVDFPRGSLVRNKVFQTRDIDQLYVSRNEFGIRINVILNSPSGQEHKVLIKSIKSLTIAKYIEQEIESHLGVKNRKVTGEL